MPDKPANVPGSARQKASRKTTTAPRNQAGRPTLAELERRKTIVMEVATQLFVAQGYSETSLVDIAKRAGVATRTLYQHFGDKEAIFRDVVFARRESGLMPLSHPVVGATLYEVLEHEAKILFAYVLADRSVELMRLMVAESRRFPELMKKVANATFARVLTNITQIFVELAGRGQIPDDDHASSARMFVDLVLGNTPIMVYTNWQTLRPAPAEIERKIDLFINGRFGPTIAQMARTHRPAAAEVPGGATGSTDRNGAAAQP
ncbi:MAG TPA: TetR/AcrR family transcriptional regulator [Sphingobium sp.]